MTGIPPTIITPCYKAPRQRVFDAWTQTQHLQNWQFPFPGFECEFIRDEIRPGGETWHKIRAPIGFEMWLFTRYEELVSPEKVVFRQYNADQQGGIHANPQMPDWPKEMQTTVLLDEDGDTTKLQLIWQPVDATDTEAAVIAVQG